MRGHVDAESLALCAEGLLSRRRSERIRSHVASCPGCAAAQARLTEVPALLAQVPPPPLPPGIAARLDAALSAETARRAAPDPGDRSRAGGTSSACRHRPAAPHRPAARPAAAHAGRGAGPGRCGRAGRRGRRRLRREPVLLVPLDVILVGSGLGGGTQRRGRPGFALGGAPRRTRGGRGRWRSVHRAPQRDRVPQEHARRPGRHAAGRAVRGPESVRARPPAACPCGLPAPP